MEITGDEQKDLKTISQLNINQVKELLKEYNKDKYGLVLADYPTRDQQYKNEMFLWVVRYVNKITKENQVEIIEYLIEKGADIYSKSKYGGWTALILASQNGHKDIIQFLLSDAGGADINAQNNYGYTALIVASRYGHKDIVKLLLQGGANINAKDNIGYTALKWASMIGHEDIVKLLLDSQNPENFYEFDKLPPEVQEDIIRRLEIDAEKEGKSPITLASEASNLDLVRYLIERQ